VRAVAEGLGYIAAWNSETQTIDIYDKNTKEMIMTMKNGSDTAKVSVGISGVMDERTMDARVMMINGGVYAPARFVAEVLAFKFEWDIETETVNISKQFS